MHCESKIKMVKTNKEVGIYSFMYLYVLASLTCTAEEKACMFVCMYTCMYVFIFFASRKRKKKISIAPGINFTDNHEKRVTAQRAG